MKKKTIIGITLLIALSIIVISFVRYTNKNKPNENNQIETEKIIVTTEETSEELETEKEIPEELETEKETKNIEDTANIILKTNEEVAKEVIKGLWGNGTERIDKLTAAGYNAAEIQKIVDNTIQSTTVKTPSSPATNSKSKEEYIAQNQNTNNVYLGNFKITGYYSGEGGVGYTSATGMPMIPWGTCAMNRYRIKDLGLHYGDYINVEGVGKLKIVDNGCSYNTVDVYVNNRSEAYALTSHRDVYRA